MQRPSPSMMFASAITSHLLSELDDCRTSRDISSILRDAMWMGNMTVAIKYRGRKWLVHADKDETINKFIDRISEKYLIESSAHSFEHCGKPLDRMSTIADNNIGDGDTIDVVVKAEMTGELLPGNFETCVTTPTGQELEVDAQADDSIDVIKAKIEQLNGAPPDQQRINPLGERLEEGRTLSDCGVKDGSTLNMDLRLAGGSSHPYKEMFALKDDAQFDHQYDCDFDSVNVNDDVVTRGGFEYRRPYGYYRIAFNIKEYGSTEWIGGLNRNWRNDSIPGEWAVSYYGTQHIDVANIAGEGFDKKKIERELHGPGIYGTNNPDAAGRCAAELQYDGKKHKVILQCRINMKNTNIITRKIHEETFPDRDWYMFGTEKESDVFYLTKSPDDIRVYGYLIKEV